jgi:hypothetical protein
MFGDSKLPFTTMLLAKAEDERPSSNIVTNTRAFFIIGNLSWRKRRTSNTIAFVLILNDLLSQRQIVAQSDA